MDVLSLHTFHESLGAGFLELRGQEAVADYGDPFAEHAALRGSAGILDLSFRGRLCVLGSDRGAFLNGQVTNNVKDLKSGHGCYAALVTARGKMQSDLNIYRLENELLLDFEPGFSATVRERLEKYIIAEDVQVADTAPHYGLWSAQGPRASLILEALSLPVPQKPLTVAAVEDATLGEIYLVNQPRTGAAGFDLFIPAAAMLIAGEKLLIAANAAGGRFCGWSALEIARLEAGVPRFGADMDETNLPSEAGLESRAISYSKGCYIGQEVIARIRTYGQVAKALRGLRLPDALPALPRHGDKLWRAAREVGYVTSAARSLALQANIALGYVRRESNEIGTELTVQTTAGTFPAQVVSLPF